MNLKNKLINMMIHAEDENLRNLDVTIHSLAGSLLREWRNTALFHQIAKEADFQFAIDCLIYELTEELIRISSDFPSFQKFAVLSAGSVGQYIFDIVFNAISGETCSEYN